MVDNIRMVELVLNDEHLGKVLGEVLANCRRRLFISTADLKDVHVPVGDCPLFPGRSGKKGTVPLSRPRRGPARSIVQLLDELARRGVEVRLLHSSIPSGPFLEELKRFGTRAGASGRGTARLAGSGPGTGRLAIRRCVRVHAKAVIADGRWMYLGSANLTGAGLGAKSARRRNFEAGIWTDELALIDPVLDMLDAIWTGRCCPDCGRKEHCPVPLEEPALNVE